jgi:rhodanese-related sulfurtransferase
MCRIRIPGLPFTSSEGRLVKRSPRSSIDGFSSSHRTLDSVRDEVAHGIAVRAIMKAKLIEGVKVGVYFTFSKKDDDAFLRHVAEIIRARIPSRHLFAIATTGAPSHTSVTYTNTLVITGTDDDDVQRAVLLFSSKFLGRVVSVTNHGNLLTASVHDIGASSYDSAALWDVLSKSVRAQLDPLSPPPGSRSIDQLVEASRARLQRVTPRQAWDILHDATYPIPAFLVDIRPASQRARSGGIHGSLIIERNDLEWRFDPRSEARLAIADRYDLRVIVYCENGYASSLAATALHDVGLLNATDMVGGFEAWKAEGLLGQIKPPSTSSESGTWEGLSQPSPVSD